VKAAQGMPAGLDLRQTLRGHLERHQEPPAGRLPRSAGLIVGRAGVRHFGRSGRQRPVDLNGVAIPAAICRVSQALAAPIPPPAAASSGLWVSPGAAAPGATWGERLGCREQASRARLADAVPEPAAPATASPPRSPECSAPCRARRLAGRAGSRHGHPLPDMHDNKAEHPAGTRAVCQLPEDNRTANQGRLPRPPHHTTRSRGAARTLPGARSSRYRPGVPAPAADP
jgi:hypothetical protein